MNSLISTINEKFPQRRILIIGDLVADQFLHGTIARVSREAPVFILRHDETETLAGGAANAAINVASLGGKAILIGLVGKDSNGEALLERLKESKVDCGSVIASSKIQTTTKIRVLAGQHYAPRQQVIRIDYENKTEIAAKLLNNLKTNIRSAAASADAIIVSDYGYGVVNTVIFRLVREIAGERKIPLLVDSRFQLKDFRGATTATPNQEEIEQILGADFTEAACARLRENLGYQALLVTRGNNGMVLFEKNKSSTAFEAVGSKEPVDVTGAGDTVIAVYALGLASGLSFIESAGIANQAGGVVVMKKGTASVSAAELVNSIENNSKFHFPHSIV